MSHQSDFLRSILPRSSSSFIPSDSNLLAPIAKPDPVHVDHSAGPLSPVTSRSLSRLNDDVKHLLKSTEDLFPPQKSKSKSKGNGKSKSKGKGKAKANVKANAKGKGKGKAKTKKASTKFSNKK
jgi:hypothetical protein